EGVQAEHAGRDEHGARLGAGGQALLQLLLGQQDLLAHEGCRVVGEALQKLTGGGLLGGRSPGGPDGGRPRVRLRVLLCQDSPPYGCRWMWRRLGLPFPRASYPAAARVIAYHPGGCSRGREASKAPSRATAARAVGVSGRRPASYSGTQSSSLCSAGSRVGGGPFPGGGRNHA